MPPTKKPPAPVQGRIDWAQAWADRIPTTRRCPTCSAPAGQPCRTVTGRPMALAHRDRSHR